MKQRNRGGCMLPIGCFLLGVLAGVALIIFLLYQWLFAGEKEEFFPETPSAITQSNR